jgi:hypothetical protein
MSKVTLDRRSLLTFAMSSSADGHVVGKGDRRSAFEQGLESQEEVRSFGAAVMHELGWITIL